MYSTPKHFLTLEEFKSRNILAKKLLIPKKFLTRKNVETQKNFS